jgi:hypothetical protein
MNKSNSTKKEKQEWFNELVNWSIQIITTYIYQMTFYADVRAGYYENGMTQIVQFLLVYQNYW